MTAAPPAIAEPGDPDEGATAVFLIALLVGFVGVIGVVVDGGAKLEAIRNADFTASEAARAATQTIDPTAINGSGVLVNQVQATAAANSYLASAGATGRVTFTTNAAGQVTAVHVRTTATYTPVVLGMLGVRPQIVHGTATAELEAN